MQEAIKNEISLIDDDPKLVKLMLDYLYQLDYEFEPESSHAVPLEEPLEPVLIPDPESPVAPAIERFEEIAETAPQPENVDDLWGSWGRPSSKKNKKRGLASSGFAAQSVGPKSTTIKDNAHPETEDTEIIIHAKVYALADKYGIHDLKDVARAKFSEAASRDWDSSSFPRAIQTVYSSTPESNQGLRDIVVSTISQHKELLERTEVETLAKEINALAFGLLQAAWGLRIPPAFYPRG